MNLITKTRKEKARKEVRIQIAFVFCKFRAFVIKMQIFLKPQIHADGHGYLFR